MPLFPRRAVLTPVPIPPPDTSAYDAWLGPLRFVTVRDELTETLGDGLEAVGAALTAAERRPRPFKLTLPVRGDLSEADSYQAGLRLRRQVRQLLENTAWTGQGLYFWFGPDPELQGWLLVGGGDLSYDKGGITFADFKLELTDCYLIGRPGQVRPARRLEQTDMRASTAARDTRGTVYSTDFAGQPLPAELATLPGDTVRLTGYAGRPLDAASTEGPVVGARRLWRTAAALSGDVINYLPDATVLPDRALALRDLEPAGCVRVWDVTSGVPVPAAYTADGDQNPTTGYGWERVYGQPLNPTALLAIDNGWSRIVPEAASRLRLERLDLDTGIYQTLARVYLEEKVVDVTVLEVVADRAVIAYRTANREVRVVLQRGWHGPRLEAYYDAVAVGAATLLIVPEGAFTRPAQTPSWVTRIAVAGDSSIFAAPVQASTTVAAETIDTLDAVRFSQPPAAAQSTLVLHTALALPGDGLTADDVASAALVDARSVPTLVATA